MAFDTEPLPVRQFLDYNLCRALWLQTQRVPAEINLRIAVFARRQMKLVAKRRERFAGI